MNNYLISNRIAHTVLCAASLMLPVAYAQAPAQPMPGMAASSSAKAGGGMDMMSMMKDMNGKMASMPMTGHTDIDFAMMMRVHHQGAIQMAEAELRDGKEGEMKKMARNIISAQKKEIAELDRFLAKHGHPSAKK